MSEHTNIQLYPEHIAIIMDGNGRWAQQQGNDRLFGHKNGIRPIRMCMEVCKKMKIKFLTLYAFSTENWKRPKEEVDGLWQLLAQTIDMELDTLIKNRIRFNVIGNTQQLNDSTKQLLQKSELKTRDYDSFTLTLALNYGSRNEIIATTQKIAQQIVDKTMNIEDITETLFSHNLMTSTLPDPDLIIRTGGELRLSNFLLWQAAYAELYFSQVLWPDFDENEFMKAIHNFQQRERRRGGLLPNKT